MNTIAKKIIDDCVKTFTVVACKNSCNEFVKSVAAKQGVTLSGTADEIVDTILKPENGWEKLLNGVEAKNKAAEGWLVIAGLKAKDTVPSEKNAQPTHGHVVIIIDGPLAKGKYPSAWWGSLSGPLPKPEKGETTVNFTWNPLSLEKVIYAAKKIG